MKCLTTPTWPKVTLLVLLTLVGTLPGAAIGKAPVKMKDFEGQIDFSTEETSPFTIEGTASHLGRFTCFGEVDFVPGTEEGSLIGDGVAVFVAANGDLLVGAVTWEVA